MERLKKIEERKTDEWRTGEYKRGQDDMKEVGVEGNCSAKIR